MCFFFALLLCVIALLSSCGAFLLLTSTLFIFTYYHWWSVLLNGVAHYSAFDVALWEIPLIAAYAQVFPPDRVAAFGVGGEPVTGQVDVREERVALALRTDGVQVAERRGVGG